MFLLVSILVVTGCDSAAPGQPNVIIAFTNDLTTSEDGDTASFGMVLATQPTNTVTIPISSSDATEGSLSVDQVEFSPTNWSAPQTVIVTGVDDNEMDGDVSFKIIIGTVDSFDDNYAGLDPADVTITNLDNDSSQSPPPSPSPSAAVFVSPVNGLTTSEAGGSAMFRVILSRMPNAAVTIAAESSNTQEGTVAPASVVFTPDNWNVAQPFTVTGVDDNALDGNVTYSVLLSSQSDDLDFDNLAIDSVLVLNLDNEDASPPPPAPPGVTVTPTGGLVTSEDQTTAMVTIVLDSSPADTVTIDVASSDATEAIAEPATLQFDMTNWNAGQTVTVTGIDDAEVDGDMAYTIAFTAQSNDADYDGITISPVEGINQDNDTPAVPGITVSPTAGLITSEDATSTAISVVLATQPADTVTVNVSSSNTMEGTVDPVVLEFTIGNWDTVQEITVTGVDDNVVDGDVDYQVEFTVQSNDADYDSITIAPVSVTNQDNDIPATPGITISPTTGLITSEDGTSTTISVVLEAQPADNVTINVSSSNTMEGTVAPAVLEFTTGNWDMVQDITVTGVDDTVVDGDIDYQVEFTVQSNDAAYDGIAVMPVTVTNQDNDTPAVPGITVSPTSGLITSEDATSDEFTVVLDAQPAAEVTIGIASSDTSEGSVMPAALVFDAGNWDAPQTVTVTGVDDSDVDGDISYSVQLTAQSSDMDYDGLIIPAVNVINQDNDVAPPPPVPDPVSYSFIVALGNLEITASDISGNGATTFPVWSFSQTSAQADVPGQVIEAVTGQTVNVEVVNDHALNHQFEVQGLLTGSAAILSGEVGSFQFTPQEAGVYLYYDPDLRSREMGMFGAVVVRPADGSNTAWVGGPAFDQERTWVITDMDDSWNRVSTFLTVDTTQYNPNYFLLNGKNGFAAKQDPASTLEGTVGETFLVRIVNAGQYDQSLHFHANHFQIISQDGVKVDNIADAPWVTTVNVKRGSTAMVLYTLDKPGTYPVHVHTAQMETGNGVYLNGTATFIIAQ